MSDTEKRILENMKRAVPKLPEAKKDYLLGFSEAIMAMADRNDGPQGKAEEREAAAL